MELFSRTSEASGISNEWECTLRLHVPNSNSLGDLAFSFKHSICNWKCSVAILYGHRMAGSTFLSSFSRTFEDALLMPVSTPSVSSREAGVPKLEFPRTNSTRHSHLHNNVAGWLLMHSKQSFWTTKDYKLCWTTKFVVLRLQSNLFSKILKQYTLIQQPKQLCSQIPINQTSTQSTT